MKHVFKRWAWRKQVNYGIAVCETCGEHFFVGNYEGCLGKPKTAGGDPDQVSLVKQ